MKKAASGFAVLLSIMLCFFVQQGSSATQSQEPSDAGVEKCKSCHTEQYESYTNSVHSKKGIPGSPANHSGCESCHGHGSSHAAQGGGKENIMAFRKTTAAKEREAKCLSCHADSRHLVFWDNGKHKAEDVTCNDCHSIHGGMEKSLKMGQPDLCFGCHKSIRMMANRQSHHPVLEGKIKCTDCHNPHGGFGEKMIKADSINELCYKCHAEKRGPFRFEHPPVAENCLNCHEVHGSNHNAMLVRKPPQLCQSCHDNDGHPGAPYTSFETFKGANPQPQMFSRACMNCHTNIHGSNGSGTPGVTFRR